MDQFTLFDPAQFNEVPVARTVDDIVAKLFLQAWSGQTGVRPLGRMQLVADPAETADLLSRPDDFPKCYSFLAQLGRSRFDTDGPEWARRRDLTQPLYREAARTANRSALTGAYDRWLTDDAILSGGIGRALLAAASEVFLHALGGKMPGGPIADWLLSLRSVAILAQHVAMFDPNPAQLSALQQGVAALRLDLRAMLSADRALMQALHAPLIGFEETFDLLGEVTINLFAGTETTVSSICWALNILARLPDTQEAIAAQLAHAGHGAEPEALDLLIQEVMRYCPPVPLLVRTVRHAGETLAGRPVPQDAMIALSIAGLHHHPDHWIDPTRFQPQRAEFANNTYHRRAYLPFSAGPRVCGGLGLARAEIAIALAAILRRYRILPVDGPIRFEYALTLRPRGTSQLRFARRGAHCG
jgi:cytochrome P450